MSINMQRRSGDQGTNGPANPYPGYLPFLDNDDDIIIFDDPDKLDPCDTVLMRTIAVVWLAWCVLVLYLAKDGLYQQPQSVWDAVRTVWACSGIVMLAPAVTYLLSPKAGHDMCRVFPATTILWVSFFCAVFYGLQKLAIYMYAAKVVLA